jgi:hypothetical protein
MKNYKTSFDLMNSLINRFNLKDLVNSGLLENLFLNLYSTSMQLKSDMLNRNQFIQFSNGFFLLLAKINAKTNYQFAFNLLKLSCPYEYLNLLSDFSDNFNFIEGIENKKLANFFFSNIIKFFAKEINHEILKKFTYNTVKNLTMFNKDMEIKINDNVFDISNDQQINSNKLNLLVNTRLQVIKIIVLNFLI